jgi:D-inositol-3-phosphate glycosyltransferase
MQPPILGAPLPGQGRRLLFLDPIGHVLGAHDHALCTELSRLGFDVTLGTNDLDRNAPATQAYRRFVAYRGIVGDGWRLRKLANYWRCQQRLIAELRQRSYDAVLQYYVLEPHLDGAFLRAGSGLGLPMVLCVNDVLPLHRTGDLFGAWRRAYASATHMIAFSAFARDRLVLDLGFSAQLIEVGQLGMDQLSPGEASGRLAARARLGIPPNERMAMCFGQIKKSKGVDVLIKAFGQVIPSLPDARLWIVGRPLHIDLASLTREIRRSGLEQKIVLRTSSIDIAEVPFWFQAADVVVLPYLRLYQSDVLLQACSHGRPVVATSVGNTPELIRDGETGWIVPPQKPLSLARALHEALSSPEEAARRGARAREELRERCSWAALGLTIGAAVSRLLSHR